MDNGASSYCRFLKGEKDAIVEIVSEYNNGLVLFLNSITGDICLSEELAEDIFCELLLTKPKYNGKSSFKTWLYAIARFHAYRLLKRRKRFVNSPVDELYELADKENLENSISKMSRKYSSIGHWARSIPSIHRYFTLHILKVSAIVRRQRYWIKITGR